MRAQAIAAKFKIGGTAPTSVVTSCNFTEVENPQLVTKLVTCSACIMLAVGILLLASCGNEPNRTLPTPYTPPGMRAVSIIVKQDISVAPRDHVDLLAMDEGQEVVVLQNVEVVTRYENIVQFVVSPDDAHLIERAVEQGQRFHLRLL